MPHSARLRHVLRACAEGQPAPTPAPTSGGGADGPTVNTSKGAVQGLAIDGVNTFRGLPFAAPPVGALRFKRSVPPEPWEGVLSCVEFGAVAPQLTPEPGQECDEDCLTLNVYNEQGNFGAPVFVWVHGGAFTSGSGSNAGYDGATLAKTGLCVVSINYRLGALGWAKLKDGDANCGLWDQIRALQWVQEEIAGFGGDPGNVTVAGESAGGTSVLSLLASPTANQLL